MTEERVVIHSFYHCYLIGIKRTFRDEIVQMIKVTTRNL
ncbi:MAG: hypothetical protein RIR39_2440 [Pseudomonadota bacterium]|jgi:hypothetical protein